jgi:putative transposase
VSVHCSTHSDGEPDLSISEQARLRELEKEGRELRMEREFLKKGSGLLRGGAIEAVYCFLNAERANSPPVKRCEWSEVSTSGFYDWAKRSPSLTASCWA